MARRSKSAATVLVAVIFLTAAPARTSWATDSRDAKAPRGVARPVFLDGDSISTVPIARLGTAQFRMDGMTWVKGLAFAADGHQVMAASEMGGVYCWETLSGKLLRVLGRDRQTNVRAFAASAHGQWAATLEARFDRESGAGALWLRVWDLAAGKESFSSKQQDVPGAGDIAISPDGATVMIRSADGTVSVWDVAARAAILTERLPDRGTGSGHFSGDGKTVLFRSGRNLWLWEWTSGAAPRKVPSEDRYLDSLALSPDGRTLATTRPGRGIEVWQLPEGRVVQRLETPEPSSTRMRDVAFSPDGHWVAAVCVGQRTIDIWEPATGRRITRLATSPGIARHPTFSPDSKWLAAADTDSAIRVWDLATGKPMTEEPPGHRAAASNLAFLGQTRLLATSGEDATVRVWDTRTGQQQWVQSHRRDDPSGGSVWVRAMAVSTDAKLVASSSLDDTVRVWDSATGREIYCLPGHGHLGGHRALAFTVDNRLQSWGDDMLLRTWDMRNGKALTEWPIRPGGIEIPENEAGPRDPFTLGMQLGPAGFSRDGRWFMLGMQSLYHVFDARTGKEVATIAGEDGHAIHLAVSPDGKWLLSSAWGRQTRTTLPDGRVQFTRGASVVRLYDRAAGKPEWQHVLQLDAGAGPVAFSPDGTIFGCAARGRPGEISVWDASTRRQVAKVTGLPAEPSGIAFSSDNRLVAAGLRDGTVLVWDLPDRQRKGGGK